MVPENTAQKSLTLVINTAEGVIQLCLLSTSADNSSTVVCSQNWVAPSQGAELLAPSIQHLLKQYQITAHDIHRILCVSGPGSFTGIRLALTTSAGIHRMTGCLQAGVNYLEVLAMSAVCTLDSFLHTHKAETFPIWVMTHARRNLLHLQGWNCNLEPFSPDRLEIGSAFELSPIGALEVTDPITACTRITSTPTAMILGSGVKKNISFFREKLNNLPSITVLPDVFSHPHPEAYLTFLKQSNFSTDDLSPSYIRPCDAEENIKNIAGQLRIDPASASATLQKLLQEEKIQAYQTIS